MVLSNGIVVEYDSPQNLLNKSDDDKTAIFKTMIKNHDHDNKDEHEDEDDEAYDEIDDKFPNLELYFYFHRIFFLAVNIYSKYYLN